MPILYLISRLPFPFLYLISDVLSFVAFYLVRYRKATVMKNLRASFPEKSEPELRIIAREFYNNLADIAVEVIKSYTISADELKKRVTPVNLEEMKALHRNGTSFMAMVPHLNNWEWIGLSCSLYLEAETNVIYQKLQTLDDFMYKLRSRFGAIPIEKKKVMRELVKKKHVVKSIGSVSDQAPKVGENRYWTRFLNQDTAFFHGTEKIARKFGYAICIIHMKRVKRGFYTIEFKLLDSPPLKSEENHYTAIFASWLEKTIKTNPSEWLWTHRRWKLTREMASD